MAEVHIFGHIESATGFPDPACFCKFAIHTGPNMSFNVVNLIIDKPDFRGQCITGILLFNLLLALLVN